VTPTSPEASMSPDRFATVVADRRLAWYSFARAITGDAASAEDCLQEALLLAWRNRDRLRDLGAVDAWVRRIVLRVSLAARRPVGRSLDQDLPASTQVEDTVLGRWTAAQAIALIEALPARQRDAVLARLLGDLPYPAIAARMGCSSATVRSLVRFGVAKVRPELSRRAA
jgi:RNA polymerase sigma factor (sigma-70 family)